MVAMKVPENYLQQAGVLNKVGEYVAPLARRVLIVAGSHALGVAGDALGHSLQREGIAFDVARLTKKPDFPARARLFMVSPSPPFCAILRP